jgi:WD40 repeat protein
VTGVAFSPDGKSVASVGLDRGAKVFDAGSGKVTGAYREHQAPLYAVTFLGEGKGVLTAGRKALHQWSVADGKKGGEGPGEGDVLKVLLHRDQVFLAGSERKVIQLGVSGFKQTRVFEGASDWIYALAVDPVAGWVAAGCYDGSVLIWNLADGKLVQRFQASPGVPPAVASSR